VDTPRRIITAAEMDGMTPQERADAVNAGIVRNIEIFRGMFRRVGVFSLRPSSDQFAVKVRSPLAAEVANTHIGRIDLDDTVMPRNPCF